MTVGTSAYATLFCAEGPFGSFLNTKRIRRPNQDLTYG